MLVEILSRVKDVPWEYGESGREGEAQEVGPFPLEDHRVRVRRRYVFEVDVIVPELRCVNLRIHHLVVRIEHVVGGEGNAVMPLDVVSQVESVGQLVFGEFPGLRKTRLPFERVPVTARQ